MLVDVITLYQPWATLAALREKGIETMSWGTKHRGILAIHAGNKIDYEACREPRIKAILEKHGIKDPSQLPTGCIIAVTQLFDCVQMVENEGSKYGVKLPGYKLSDQEYDFGYYTPGRFACILANIRRPKEPLPAKGKQRIWKFDINTVNFKGQEWD
jgi:hypothetical protein